VTTYKNIVGTYDHQPTNLAAVLPFKRKNKNLRLLIRAFPERLFGDNQILGIGSADLRFAV